MPLIIFEGPDGCGKTTLAKKLAYDNQYAYYAFPGREDGTLGEAVYKFHHSMAASYACPEALQLLHVAAHINALKTRLLPWLDKGVTVVLDRFYWSTYVYGKAYDAPANFLHSIIELELPLWKQYLDDAKLFYITRPKPFNKSDDAKSFNQWQLISYGYDALFNYSRWDNIERLRVENLGTPDHTLQLITDFIKDSR